jgi:hypothetical protein
VTAKETDTMSETPPNYGTHHHDEHHEKHHDEHQADPELERVRHAFTYHAPVGDQPTR